MVSAPVPNPRYPPQCSPACRIILLESPSLGTGRRMPLTDDRVASSVSCPETRRCRCTDIEAITDSQAREPGEMSPCSSSMTCSACLRPALRVNGWVTVRPGLSPIRPYGRDGVLLPDVRLAGHALPRVRQGQGGPMPEQRRRTFMSPQDRALMAAPMPWLSRSGCRKAVSLDKCGKTVGPSH